MGKPRTILALVSRPLGGQDQGDGMSAINPDDIESITVLKGANAAALYGARAKQMVLLTSRPSEVINVKVLVWNLIPTS